MTDIVAQLAELIVKDNALLLVGSDLSSSENRTSLVQQIADALAARMDYTKPDRSLAAVARDFQAMQGRNALITALREEVARSQAAPSPILQLIADAVLPNTKVITTRFDRTLEQAFDQFRKPYVLIVRDTDVSFFDESKLTLIKIQGDIEQPDSLVITADDVEDFISNLPTLSDVVRAFFATKTLIFLGYDLESDQFKRLFRQVTRNLSVYRRTAYAIQDRELAVPDRRYWEDQGVDIRTQDPVRFLEELASAVKELVQRPLPAALHPLEEKAPDPLPPAPYPGLRAFTLADAPVFFGRTQEIRQLTVRVLANRLTVLYGESGSGKSSLIHAGLGPALAQRRGLMAVGQVQGGTAFTGAMLESLRAAASQAGLDLDASAGLADTLRTLQHRLDGPVVLVLDDGERFFEAFTGAEQAAVLAHFHDLLVDRSLDLRLVIVIREELLGRMAPLEQRLPGLLDVRYRVDRLTREAAREALEGPAQRYGLGWAPSLIQQVLTDLQEGESQLISPAQLQILAQRLYQVAADGKRNTLALADLEALGGVAAILGSFLDEVLSTLEPAQQILAKTLLGALVTSSGSRQRLSGADLARSLGGSSAQDLAQGQPLLDFLIDRSLVRRMVLPPRPTPMETGADPAPPSDPLPVPAYELSHDYLAGHIVDWLGQEFWDTQRAREILRQALPDWMDRGRLLPAQDLDLVTDQHGLLQPTPDEARLLFASAVAYDRGMDRWRPGVPAPDQRSLLLALCAHGDATVRARAATRLADFPDGEVAVRLTELALTDADPSVEAAAAFTLAGLADRASDAGAQAVGVLSAAAQAGGTGQTRALSALATMRDLAPSVQKLLPPDLAKGVRRRVWRLRWRRSREWAVLRTVRGLQGGFWGLGLGMGLFLGLNRLIADGYSLALLAQRFESILFGISSGIPVMGVMGATASAVTAGAGALLTGLEDRPDPRRTWAVQTGAGAVTLALLWLLFAFVFPGETVALRTLAAGGLIGLGLFGVATAPWPWSEPVRLGVGAAAGAGILLLAYALGLVFVGEVWWVVWMGAISGLGVTWGLPSIKRGRDFGEEGRQT